MALSDRLSTQHAALSTCSYCGLVFAHAGYSPGNGRSYCCSGCYLVERILGTTGEDGIATGILLRLGVGAFLAMNVMMISLVLYAQSPAELGYGAVRGFHWALLALATPAMLILEAPYVLGAIRDLRRLRLSTDALILTGSLTAYAASTVHVVRGAGHVYFDTATMLLLIVTLGRLMEASAKNRTSQAIRDLVELIPSTARVLRDDVEVEIASDELHRGDVLVVRPGERIAADGRVLSGECMVEEAAFTGEPRPRACAPGDCVYGGSVNCDGLIHVQAMAVGTDSTLAQIQRMVSRAQQERAPVERLVERVASVFVPSVWLIALAAGAYWGLVWGDIERAGMSALAVLVVACPCAMGLATPMAACLAIGKAARAGVLLRSGEVLERLPLVSRIFFDKTGTLTDNRLSVVAVITDESTTESDALSWAAALESGSEHALARAIVTAADQRQLPRGSVSEFRAIPGRGVEGTIVLDGVTRRVTAGSLKLLEQDHETPDSLTPRVDPDLTAVYAGWERRTRAAILLTDTPRPEAARAIEQLTNGGIAAAVISGDLSGPVRRVAAQLGIESVISECTPAEKAEAVRKARETSGAVVAMVGDGINDAPALAQADVGIAVGGGTDLARQSSDVTLLGDDLSRIPWVIELSRRAYRIIRQNLIWAFGYNCAAIILAFLGYVHPLIAALAMFASSVCVIGNSTRLAR